jgi:hypothetical protein
MSLTSRFLRSVALPAMLAFSAVSAPALAEVPAVGQCGPAEQVKAELTKTGYGNYFVYEVKLFDEKTNAARWTRQSVVANDTLAKGYHVGRRGDSDDQLCVLGSLSNIILADPARQAAIGKVDARFYKNQPKADIKGGINRALDGAATSAMYPAVQARVKESNGGEGYMTIILNPQTHEGARLFSELSGTFFAGNTQLEAGKKERTGFTPLAEKALAQTNAGEKRVESGSSPAVPVTK